MAHNIFGSRFIGHREPAWHQLGTVFDEPISAVEAIQRAGLDFHFDKMSIYCFNDNGDPVAIPDKRAIVRRPTDDDPEFRPISVVSADYTLFLNIELAQAIESLTDLWPVETAGALGKGGQLFLSLAAGECEIAGDVIKQFFLLYEDRTGNRSLQLMITPVRVVCQNTLITGIRSAMIQLGINHVGSSGAMLELSVESLRKAQGSMTEVIDAMNELALVFITDVEINEIIAAAYPMPPKPRKLIEAGELSLDEASPKGQFLRDIAEQWSHAMERQVLSRVTAWESFDMICQDNSEIAFTPWAAYNAVVEAEDYRPHRGPITLSEVLGPRAEPKKRAFKKATEIIS